MSLKLSARILPRLAVIALFSVALSGCQTMRGLFDTEQPATEVLPVVELYEEAREFRDGGNFSRAETYLQRLISRFPFGPHTEQAYLDLAYVQFKQGKHEESTATIDRFIRTYPRHQAIDYVYYLRALNDFQRESFFLQRVARADMSARDLERVRASFESFASLLRRFPDSRYAVDSRQRMIYLRNILARHEINTGIFYHRRGAHVSAISRATYLLETYPQSEFEADAVALLAASYSALGLENLADDATRVLRLNAPDHPYFRGEWPREPGIWSQLNPFGGGR